MKIFYLILQKTSIYNQFKNFIRSSIMLNTTGSISLGKILIIVKVLKSNATLVPTFSFLVSIAFLHVTTYLGPLSNLIITFFIFKKN